MYNGWLEEEGGLLPGMGEGGASTTAVVGWWADRADGFGAATNVITVKMNKEREERT